LRVLGWNWVRPLLLLLAVAVLTNGCGGGGTSVAISAIAVTLSTGQTATVQPGHTLTITATITNDFTDAGLVWSIVPVTGANGCGSYSVPTDSPDTTVVYTAPPSSSAPCTATVKATSVADAASSASVMITVP
jgi:hypothetical protein